MSFRWQVPSPLLDESALARMRSIGEPRKPMVEAWFMGDVTYMTWLQGYPPQELVKNDRKLQYALDEILGVIFFPKTSARKEWKEWFLYLLPYILVGTQDYIGSGETTMSLIIPILFAIYPDSNIIEEYDGFRHDLVYTVGMRYMHSTSRTFSYDLDPAYPLVTGRWDDATYSGLQLPRLKLDFSLSMLFCLKYLRPSELESWVDSLVSIDSAQWQVAILRWCLAFDEFWKRAQDWPEDGEISCFFEHRFKETKPLKVSNISLMIFESRDAFIPTTNWDTFRAEIARQFTPEKFQAWVANIKQRGIYERDYQSPPLDELGEYYRLAFENLFEDFELAFFIFAE
jgi:hypothetical protein